MEASKADIVRGIYTAFAAGERQAVDDLLAEDFKFTSPDDPNIDKATYFERCWPNHDHIRSFHIEKLFEQGDEVFVRYEAERTNGERFRNTEYLRLEGNQIKEVQVYYGASL